jgi:hypothetical protein
MEGRAPNKPGPAVSARIAAAAASRHPKAMPQLDGAADHDDDDASESADDVQPVSFEEENRLAKMEALKMLEEEEARAPPPMRRSIFDKGNGKKIRIVSKS